TARVRNAAPPARACLGVEKRRPGWSPAPWRRRLRRRAPRTPRRRARRLRRDTRRSRRRKAARLPPPRRAVLRAAPSSAPPVQLAQHLVGASKHRFAGGGVAAARSEPRPVAVVEDADEPANGFLGVASPDQRRGELLTGESRRRDALLVGEIAGHGPSDLRIERDRLAPLQQGTRSTQAPLGGVSRQPDAPASRIHVQHPPQAGAPEEQRKAERRQSPGGPA